MKLILSQNYGSCIYVDTKNELGLGLFDFALVGDYQVAAYINGEFSVMSFPRPDRLRRRPRAAPAKKSNGGEDGR